MGGFFYIRKKIYKIAISYFTALSYGCILNLRTIQEVSYMDTKKALTPKVGVFTRRVELKVTPQLWQSIEEYSQIMNVRPSQLMRYLLSTVHEQFIKEDFRSKLYTSEARLVDEEFSASGYVPGYESDRDKRDQLLFELRKENA